MNLGDRIIHLLKADGRHRTIDEINGSLRANRTSVSAACSMMAMNGVLGREKFRDTATGRPQYKYYLLDETKPKFKKNPNPRFSRRRKGKNVTTEGFETPPATPLPGTGEPVREDAKTEGVESTVTDSEFRNVAAELPSERIDAPPEPIAATADIVGMINNMAAAMSDLIMRQLKVELGIRTAQLITSVTAHAAVAPTPKELADRLSRALAPKAQGLASVLIVGLLPAQAGMISTEFHDCFDLRFWKDGSLSDLKEKAKNADYAITFTSKIGHDAEAAVKTANRPLIRVSGGMTSLREKLTELYVEHTSGSKS